MQYLLTALEGVISFVSPCVLPLLPVYVSYFVGDVQRKRSPLLRALCFVFGFTLVFCLMGLFAGSAGSLLNRYQKAVNLVCGAVVVLLGLSYLEIIHLPFFKGVKQGKRKDGAFFALVFGMVYAVSLSPCVGAFLGAALMQASTAGTAKQGVLLLLCYSLGLGLPFLFAAMLLDRLKTAFSRIKRHYQTINRVCGGFLIAVGVCMMFGWLQKLLALVS